ncbi:MAG: hypothetical protein DRJ40_03400 [Thermoprotei archaeon]|nr:MAG: hypothetical protein DRJ40_03400 [Thermoprotei archaeon]
MRYLQRYLYYYGDERYIVGTWLRSLLYYKDSSLSSYEVSLMSQVAYSDLLNYLLVKWGILRRQRGSGDPLLLLSERLNYELRTRPMKLYKLIDDWLDFWLVKWRQRVKLVFSESELESASLKELISEVEPVISRLDDLVTKLYRALLPKLIDVLEICFTNVVLDGLIKTEIKRMLDEAGLRSVSVESKVKYIRRHKAVLYRRLVNRIRELPKLSVPLVILRVDRSILVGSDVKPLLYT